MVTIRGGGAGIENGGVLATLEDGEICGAWHHFALVFKFDDANGRSRWSFYLDGVNRGTRMMPNHAANANVQHDRFLLGGLNSASKKVLDAKFAFWRVSDEALPPDSMLCARSLELATTVAYWPMNAISAFYGDEQRMIVPDAVDARNSLMIRSPDHGGVSWGVNDIGWTTPPNPDAELVASGVDCRSTGLVHSGNNTNKIGNLYREVFSTFTNAPVIEALTPTNSFTVEGYVKFDALPAAGDKNQMFLYNTLGEKGGWCWNLFGPDADGCLSMKVSYCTGSSRLAVSLGERFRAEEMLNVWNHYALTFTPDNGRGQTEWRCYVNGRLLGKSNAMPAYGTLAYAVPKFYLSGCGSGANPQAICGDMTCWRVSRKALKPTALLCGTEAVNVPADALVWSGTAESGVWSTGSEANWTANGAVTAWSDGKDAYFDDRCVADFIAITGAVNPASINVLADRDIRVDFGSSPAGAIADGCTNLVKRGFGTFELSYGGNSPHQLLQGTCPIDVREGVLKITAVNSTGGLGDASRGYEVKIHDHATLWLNGRNAIGSGVPDVANESVITVYTNGTFDIGCGGGIAIQALGALDLLGGDLVSPSRCHNLGYLQIRNRLSAGHNLDRRAYVFPAVIDNGGQSASGGITIGRNTEFRVEDVTGDGASDAVFNCAVLARTRDSWQTASTPCGFRKTGAGTMELNSGVTDADSQARPSGIIAVEAGELKVNNDYRGPSLYTVADGAFLSGTGKVSLVAFAAGAGVRVDVRDTDVLELAGARFSGAGTVEIVGVPESELENLNVTCARMAGAVTDAANLAAWTVKVDGAVLPRASVQIVGGCLTASVAKGTIVVFR